ncbi:MAG: flagellar biosynthesis protein FlhB [Pseudomonadota bacterium]
MAEDAGSKTEEPTPKKLEDARKKGDIAKSQDISQLASLVGAFSVLAIGGGWFARDMAMQLLPFVAHPQDYDLSSGGLMLIGQQATMAAAPTLIAVLFAAALAGFAGNVFQTGLMWTGEKLKPDFKKVSPMEGFKKIFGIDGFVQFLKSVLKIFVTGWVAWLTLKSHWGELGQLAALDPAAMLPLCAEILKALFYSVMAFLAATALVDFIWQKIRFTQKMRMTREELKDEYKQSDGDPHVKAKQKQIRAERSRRRMMQSVPTATVVVMNPTHYAVALRYEAGVTGAPECVAKGLDDLALRIRALAEEHGVPIVEDPPLARALYAAVEVDQQIPESHFEAVAKVIGFILGAAQRRQASRGSGGRARPL